MAKINRFVSDSTVKEESISIERTLGIVFLKLSYESQKLSANSETETFSTFAKMSKLRKQLIIKAVERVLLVSKGWQMTKFGSDKFCSNERGQSDWETPEIFFVDFRPSDSEKGMLMMGYAPQLPYLIPSRVSLTSFRSTWTRYWINLKRHRWDRQEAFTRSFRWFNSTVLSDKDWTWTAVNIV